MMSNHTMMLDDALQSKLSPNETVEVILTDVFDALETKGYNPISGDPAYISSYQGARNKIQQIERDEIIEVLLEKFVETKK